MQRIVRERQNKVFQRSQDVGQIACVHASYYMCIFVSNTIEISQHL